MPEIPKLTAGLSKLAWVRQTPGGMKFYARQFIIFSATIIFIFSAMVIYQGTESYRRAIALTEDAADRLAHTMRDYTGLTLLSVDQTLRRAVERQHFNALFGGNLLKFVEQSFKLWLQESPQIAALAQIRADGKVLVAAHKEGYEKWLDYSGTLTDQALFSYLKEADDRFVFIGRHTASGKGLIVLARRYSEVNGEFGGIMLAAVDPAHFVDFYGDIAFGDHKFMALTLTDGTVLAVGPENDKDDIAMLTEMTRMRATVTNAHQTSLARFNVESNDKIGATLPLLSLPINVNTILDERDFLKGWHQERAKDIGFLTIFVLFGTILSFSAITMSRQIKRAEESESAAILASQAKSDFLANMSHELRTPLNAIIGFSEMIGSGYFGPLNAKQKDRIHDINLCGTHLLQLISDILEFSKGDAGKLELAEETFDIGEIVQEGVRILSAKIKTKNIQLSVSIDDPLPKVWADKRKIRQILLNLVTNAIKFTPENGQIRIAVLLDQTNHLHLMVSDTGIGISEDDIPKALSVFGQVHRNKSHEGTGLGLPLCKMYTELHGGRLQLTSQVGEGTTVRITLPPARLLIGKNAAAS